MGSPQGEGVVIIFLIGDGWRAVRRQVIADRRRVVRIVLAAGGTGTSEPKPQMQSVAHERGEPSARPVTRTVAAPRATPLTAEDEATTRLLVARPEAEPKVGTRPVRLKPLVIRGVPCCEAGSTEGGEGGGSGDGAAKLRGAVGVVVRRWWGVLEKQRN